MAQTKVKDGLLNFPDRDDFIQLPSGTTAQRPSSPEQGYSRYNTTDKKLEFWNGTIWQQLPGVVAPIITSLSYPGDDLAADPVGGQTITINGSDFKTGATVTIGGTTPSVITFVSATEITFEAPAKTAGDYDVVVTNVDGGNATSVDGMSYNGVPSWTTAAGNLGTFPAGSTIPTITLVATEPDSGTISYSVTTGALPTGLTLTGADIDGSVPTPAGETTYNFSVTASDDENQSTERAFNIVVYLQVTNTVSEVDPFGDSSGLALYRLENNANDEGGVYNGTWSGTAAYSAGVFGQAANFNGSSSYVSIGEVIPSTNTDCSFSCWFNMASSFNSDYKSILGGNGSDSFRITIRYVSSGNYNIEVARGREGVLYYTSSWSSTPLSPSTWYNLVVTYSFSNNTANIYINDSFINSKVLNLSATSTINTNLVLGSYRSDVGFAYFNGSIDQVRIFNKALTPLEVQSLYQERTVLCGGQAETVDILGDNSCIALYPLDGNANDLSGNYSGTPTDVSYGVGEFDLAGVFNGSSSWIDLSDNSFKLSTIAVSAWFNSASTQNLQNIYSCYDYQGQSRGFNIRLQDNNLILFQTYKSNVNSSLFSSSQIQRNTWNHVAVVATQSSVSIYINGSLDNSGSIVGFDYFTTHPFSIGRAAGEAEHYFDGSIDQVRIFNKALSAAEVTTLYNETACDVLACSGTTNTLDILGDSSCVAAYPLDGSPLDLSGNYNGVQTDVTYPVGKFDLGGSFNGSSSKIAVSQDFGIGDISKNWTSSVWAKTDSTGSEQIYFARQSNNHNVSFNGGNTVEIAFYQAAGGNNTIITGVTASNWNHIVVSHNASTTTATIYVNNVLKTTINTSGTQALSVSDFTFAAHPTISSLFYQVNIDQARFFNKALSAGEVTTLYNETACN